MQGYAARLGLGITLVINHSNEATPASGKTILKRKFDLRVMAASFLGGQFDRPANKLYD
jgi:hypothetical protein